MGATIVLRIFSELLLLLGLSAVAFVDALVRLGIAMVVLRAMGADEAFITGFATGHRNVGLMAAAQYGSSLPELTWLYFALVQLPIYLTPQIIRAFDGQERTRPRRVRPHDGVEPLDAVPMTTARPSPQGDRTFFPPDCPGDLQQSPGTFHLILRLIALVRQHENHRDDLVQLRMLADLHEVWEEQGKGILQRLAKDDPGRPPFLNAYGTMCLAPGPLYSGFWKMSGSCASPRKPVRPKPSRRL